MKCARCQMELVDDYYTIVRTSRLREDMTLNVCVQCCDDTVGHAARKKLDTLIVIVGWRQLPIPEDAYR